MYSMVNGELRIFFHYFQRRIIKGGLQSKTTYIFYLFTLWKGIDDAQPFLGYIFFEKTLFSHIVLLSITCISVTGENMIKRRQL